MLQRSNLATPEAPPQQVVERMKLDREDINDPFGETAVIAKSWLWSNDWCLRFRSCSGSACI